MLARRDAGDSRHTLERLLEPTPRLTAAPAARLARTMTATQAKLTLEDVDREPGVQRDKVFMVIRECSERATLAADAAVQAILRRELTGHDLWHAQLLLRYGNESAYPPAISELWAATDGAAHDKPRAFRALQALNPTQMQEIAAVPGLRDILAEFNAASEVRATTDLLSGDYAGARQRHVANVATFNRVLAGMLASTNVVYRNTAQALSPPRPGARPRIAVKVFTPTHDAAARATHHSHPGDFAFFGGNDVPPNPAADYDAEVTSARGIVFDMPPDQADGWNDAGRREMGLMDPARGSDTYLRDVLLTHEAQHGLDRHEDEPGGHGNPDTSPLAAWNSYKTEFRAYWITNEYDSHSTRRVTAAAPWRSDKQYAIFNHMYTSSTYAYVATHWDADASLPDGRRFRAAIQDYAVPEGVNLINSIRIDDFYTLLGGCQPTHRSPSASPISDLIAAAGRFDPADRTYVNSGEAWRLQNSIGQRLHWGALLTTARAMNDGTTVPAWAWPHAALDITVRGLFLAGTTINDEAAVIAKINGRSATERAVLSNSSDVDLAITVFLPAAARPRVRAALGAGTGGATP